jgi:hypothetical protein
VRHTGRRADINDHLRNSWTVSPYKLGFWILFYLKCLTSDNVCYVNQSIRENLRGIRPGLLAHSGCFRKIIVYIMANTWRVIARPHPVIARPRSGRSNLRSSFPRKRDPSKITHPHTNPIDIALSPMSIYPKTATPKPRR